MLPTAYAGMIVLAIVPPGWRGVADPRVLAHFGGDLTRANIQPRKRDKFVATHGGTETPPVEEVARRPSRDRGATGEEILAARCPGCGHTDAVAVGNEHEGVAAGTAWADIPEDWWRPDCGVCEKRDFLPVDGAEV